MEKTGELCLFCQLHCIMSCHRKIVCVLDLMTYTGCILENGTVGDALYQWIMESIVVFNIFCCFLV